LNAQTFYRIRRRLDFLVLVTTGIRDEMLKETAFSDLAPPLEVLRDGFVALREALEQKNRWRKSPHV
jgi:hypothetical protein